jgi:hypothetical protein
MEFPKRGQGLEAGRPVAGALDASARLAYLRSPEHE